MRRIAFTKVLALLLCAILTLGLFAGCGNNETPKETKPIYDPTPVGMLMVACDATLQITYDGSGLVQKLEAGNEEGQNIVAEYADNEPIGITCAELVADLIRKCFGHGYIPMENGNVVIKQAHDSTLPSATFLEDIAKVAQELAAEKPVVIIRAEDLDENGYITEAAARILLQQTLGLNSPETVRVVGQMEDGQYTFVAIVGGRQNMYSVHVVTGQVTGIIVQEPNYDGYYEETPDTNPVFIDGESIY